MTALGCLGRRTTRVQGRRAHLWSSYQEMEMASQLVWNRRLTGSLGAQRPFLPEDQGSVHCLQDLGLQPVRQGLSVPARTLELASVRLPGGCRGQGLSLCLPEPPLPSGSRRRFYVFVHLYSRTLKSLLQKCIFNCCAQCVYCPCRPFCNIPPGNSY